MSKSTKTTSKTRPTSAEITLTGQVFKLTKPLTLWQARDIGVGCAGVPLPEPAAEFRRLFDNAVNIIAVGLAAEHPEITAEFILNSAATPEEMWKAMDDVLQFAGLSRQESSSGEAQAAAT